MSIFLAKKRIAALWRSWVRTLPVSIACLFAWHSCLSQDLLITNAHILDGLGQKIESGDVLVSDGLVRSLGENIPRPDDVTVIDASGMTVMPGMINPHWRLYAGSAAGTDAALDKFRDDAIQRSLEAILDRGITTVMSLGDHYPNILAIRDDLASSALRGPRLLAVGPVFTSLDDWPTQICGPDDACNDRLNAVVSNEEQARAKVRELAAANVDALKLVYDDIIAPDARIDDALVSAIADEGQKHDLRLLAHLSSTEVAASRLVELGVDGFVHSAMDVSGALPELRNKQIPVITTVTAALTIEEREHVLEPEFTPAADTYYYSSLESIRTLWQAEVPVVFGTDSVAGPPGLNPGFLPLTVSGEGPFVAELRALSRVLSNEQIITSLTQNAALFVGMQDEIGTLEPGKIADIIIIDGNPLVDILDLQNVRMVIQSGVVATDNR